MYYFCVYDHQKFWSKCLIKKEPVVFDDKYIVPACINEDNTVGLEPEGKVGWLTGWGMLYIKLNFNNSICLINFDI